MIAKKKIVHLVMSKAMINISQLTNNHDKILKIVWNNSQAILLLLVWI